MCLSTYRGDPEGIGHGARRCRSSHGEADCGIEAARPCGFNLKRIAIGAAADASPVGLAYVCLLTKYILYDRTSSYYVFWHLNVSYVHSTLNLYALSCTYCAYRLQRCLHVYK